MRPEVSEIVNNIEPGEHLDIDLFGDNHGRAAALELIEALEINGYTVNGNGKVGLIQLCDECDGEGLDDDGNDCPICEGYSSIVDYGGRRVVPYKS